MSNRQPFSTAPKDRQIIAWGHFDDAYIIQYSDGWGDARWLCDNGDESTYRREHEFTTWAEIPA